MSKQEVKALFFGKVQGVFFRSHVKKIADELKIFGYAKNLSDGSVEVRAVGEKKELENFLMMIKKTPGLGKIEKVMTQYFEKSNKYSEFSTH